MHWGSQGLQMVNLQKGRSIRHINDTRDDEYGYGDHGNPKGHAESLTAPSAYYMCHQ